MWIQPVIIKAAKDGKTTWVVLKQSLQFKLQESSESDNEIISYRIVTRSFPTYIVATGDKLSDLDGCFQYLHETFLENFPAKKPKDLVKNLKSYYHTFPIIGSDLKDNQNDEDEYDDDIDDDEEEDIEEEEEDSEDEKTVLDTSNSEFDSSSLQPKKKPSINRLSKNVKQPEPVLSSSDSTIASEDDNIKKPLEIPLKKEVVTETLPKQKVKGTTQNTHVLFSFIIKLISLFNLPITVQETNDDSNSRTLSFKFHNSLLKPSPFLDDGVTKKSTVQMTKEAKKLKTKRNVLIIITFFFFFLRFCSFDLFMVVLMITNGGVLYFLNNSAKVSALIAKHVMKNKMGNAKKWAGGLLFKRDDDSEAEPAPVANTTADTSVASKFSKRASLFFRKSVVITTPLNFDDPPPDAPAPSSNLASFLPANRN